MSPRKALTAAAPARVRPRRRAAAGRALFAAPVALVALLAAGCLSYVPLGFSPPEGEVVRHVYHEVNAFDFEPSTVTTKATIVYDEETTAFAGRPARNRITVRRYDFEAEPWDHPAMQGRAATVAALVGQEFKVDMDEKLQSSIVHLGGKRVLEENFRRVWIMSEEAMIFPGFFKGKSLTPGTSWTGASVTGDVRSTYAFTVEGTEKAEGETLYRVVADIDGAYRMGQVPIEFRAKFKGLYNAEHAYFPKAVYDIEGKGPQFTFSRQLNKLAKHFDEVTLPPVEESGLSPWQEPKNNGLVIDDEVLKP